MQAWPAICSCCQTVKISLDLLATCCGETPEMRGGEGGFDTVSALHQRTAPGQKDIWATGRQYKPIRLGGCIRKSISLLAG